MLAPASRNVGRVAAGGVLERDGCQLHWWLHGPEQGSPIVLSHGATLDHEAFDPQLDALARDHRVLTWDARGHGRSKPLGAFSARVATDDLLAIVEAAGIREAVFVGQSMGGNISQEVAYRRPELARALVLVGCACNTCDSRSFVRSLRLAGRMMRLTPEPMVRREIARQAAVTAEARAYATRAGAQLDRRELAAIWAALPGFVHHDPSHRIGQPLLLVRGERDRLGGFHRQMPRWASDAPRARHVLVPKAGHCANLDRPTYFNGVLLDFLREIDVTSVDERSRAPRGNNDGGDS